MDLNRIGQIPLKLSGAGSPHKRDIHHDQISPGISPFSHHGIQRMSKYLVWWLLRAAPKLLLDPKQAKLLSPKL